MARFLITSMWLAAGLCFGLLICEPVSLQAHFALGLTIVALMIVINLFGLDGIWRQLFLCLGTGIVFRYFYWRTTSTLPPTSDVPSFVAGIILWAAEAYSITMLAISLFVVAAPLRRKPAPRLAPETAPSVDVFVPTYNEDKSLLAITLAAATAMDYPADKLRVHLLDDGGTDAKCASDNPEAAQAARRRRADLQQLAADIGVAYRTRAENLHAKAGNLNAALQGTTGELVAVFDADHVPMPDFLQETVGFFREDPTLFLCQTPHTFSNPDPVERNLRTFATMPSENEMFYGTVQRGLDKWNGAFFCGSAAVLRRAALQAHNGFSGVTITEDCETALDLHALGWRSVYIDKPLISGLQPDTFAAFIGQRSRWARGMFQIFLLKNPLWKRGLNLGQRICYLSSMGFWLFPLFRLPYFIAPLLYIWFSMQIYVASFHEFFAYTAVYMAVNVLIQNYLFGTLRWPLVSELYEYVQSIYLSRSLLTVIMHPRKPTFNVTDKGNTLDKDFVSELAAPYFVIFAVVLASQIYAGVRFFTDHGSRDLLFVISLWNFLNLLLAGAALGVVAERRATVQTIGRAVELAIGTGLVPATLLTLTTAGCRLKLPANVPIGQPIPAGTAGVLAIPNGNQLSDARTLPVFLADGELGPDQRTVELSFPPLKADHYRTIVSVLHPGSAPLMAARDRRRTKRSILGGLVGFAAWGLREPWRAGAALARQSRRKDPLPGSPGAVAGGVVPAGLAPASVAVPVAVGPHLPVAVGHG